MVAEIGQEIAARNNLHNASITMHSAFEEDVSHSATPTKMDISVRHDDASTPARKRTTLSTSTPRRKRCGMLANLHSDLSPKYIGFVTPPLLDTVRGYGSESNCDEKKRLTRRQNVNGSNENNDCVNADDTTFVPTMLGCIRRTRSSNSIVVGAAAPTTPNKTTLRKPFVSPIDKLLARNGSTVVTAISDDLLNSTVMESFNHKGRGRPPKKSMGNHLKNGMRKNENSENVSNKAKTRTESKIDYIVQTAMQDDASDEAASSAGSELGTKGTPSEVTIDEGSTVCVEPPIDDQHLLNATQLAFERRAKLEVASKSPSAMSLDSAKGSSVITGMTWMSFITGDLFWGQIYSYCYWPCMVCPDPDNRTIMTERDGHDEEEHILVHVRFFADNARRNWVKRENLKPFVGAENYKEYVREMRDKLGKKNPKYRLLLPKQSQITSWRRAIYEANMVAEAMYEDRMEKFYEILERKKTLLKLERKRRQSNPELGRAMDSYDCEKTAIKRDRSTSPFSPVYSPLKSISSIKRRRLSEGNNQEETPPTSLSNHTTDLKTPPVKSPPVAIDSTEERGVKTRRTSSLNASEDLTLFNNNDFKKFHDIMKEFVMERNHDADLERSLTVAVRNIWALKQLNRTQMERRLFENFNADELGSSLVEPERGEGTVKRLSNRLKGLMVRRSLPERFSANQKPNVEAVSDVAAMSTSTSKPKRQLNMPIEDVIEDIFNLDSKYLFKGLNRDPVCKYCFKANGNLVKCSKSCQSWLHTECIGKIKEVEKVKGRRSLKRAKRESNSNLTTDKANMNQAIIETENGEATSKIAALSTAPQSMTHITADGETLVPVQDAVCEECAANKPLACTVCDRPEDANPGSEPLVICNMPQCSKAFHPSCCRYWPQAKVTKSKNQIESFRCPSHVCHTCVSDDPKSKFQHLSNSKLTRCIKCPASFHTDSTCIPAGSQILTAAYIICPRHSNAKSDAQVNVSWCFVCVGGGQVMCCETCPTAVHAACINTSMDSHKGGYICEECESGRMPLYGEMVWAKFNSFRWWPALILPPPQVPQNIMRKSHNASDFVVRFFGTHDHGWISRRRVYLYLEGDSSEPPRTKSHLDQNYKNGVDEAKKICEIIKLKKQTQRLSNEDKEKLHPQPYVRIKANRAVYPVKLHANMEKVNKCECRPDDENPCGPDSNCLNRVLYHECNPTLCPAGDRCQNQMFASRISPRLDVVYMKERGFGLVCRESVNAGTFIIEYVGEVINDDEFQQRVAQKASDRDENFYFLSVEKDYIIDAGPKGNLARFMNHSCDPNCETQKWLVNGLNRIGLFAIKDIQANTELTFNYHWDELLGAEKKKCFCGAVKCAGQIGAKYKEDKINKEMEVITKAKLNSMRKGKTTKRLSKTSRVRKNKSQIKVKLNTTKSKTSTKSKTDPGNTTIAEGLNAAPSSSKLAAVDSASTS